MLNFFWLSATSFLALVACSAVTAGEPKVQISSIALLNAIPDFERRVPDANAVAKSINRLKPLLSDVLSDQITDENPYQRGLLVVAVSSDGEKRMWFDLGDQDKSELGARIAEASRPIQFPNSAGKPYVFSLNIDVGIKPETSNSTDPDESVLRNGVPPLPVSWQLAMQEDMRVNGARPFAIPDDALAILWPEAMEVSLDAPEGYSYKSLAPLGGQILLPDGWHFKRMHSGPSITWILSKEDTSKGPYETGMRIQFAIGVDGALGESAERFAKDYLAKKRKESSVVHTEFPIKKQGMFFRQGIEVTESINEIGEAENYRINYSVFWTEADADPDEPDFFVVTTTGTPEDQWEEHQDIFKHMSSFTLLDLK